MGTKCTVLGLWKKFNHIGKNRITSGPNLEIFHQESSFRMVLQKSVWKRKDGAIHLSL